MREVMRAHEWREVFEPPRRKPLYYQKGSIVVLGHYDSTCGGCDNIGSAPQVYELVRKVYRSVNMLVLCEGLLLSEDVIWTARLLPAVKTLFLTTPLEVCIERVVARRLAAGNLKPFNAKITEKRFETIERARKRLIALGANPVRCSVSQASKMVRGWCNGYL